MRTINLQRLLDRKGQIATNIQASNSYLSTAEANLNTISDVLSKLRGDVVGVTGTLTTDADRQTLIQQINQALFTLVGAGNAKSQGRYLFAGSVSQTQPYDYVNDYVRFSGNESPLRSYVDIERLFDTNLSGVEVFGGISSQIRGIDLNPQLSEDTLVTTINGGEGISRGAAISVSINTGPSTKKAVIDVSRAVTLGDVARMIEAGAPAGTEIVADVTGDGLKLYTPSGTILIEEIAESNAARELGILTPEGAPLSDTIVGMALNPAVIKTTRLDSLLGTRAQGRIVSTDANNDIVIRAANNGAAYNNVTVVFAAGGTAGSENVTYDANTQTLTVQVAAGVSTATQVAAAITAEGTFTAEVDYHDATSDDDIGTNPVQVTNFGSLTFGGSGQDFDSASGLTITNRGETKTIDTSTAETVEGLMNLIIGSGLDLSAEINATRDGIDVRSRLSGADFAIGENGGTTATQLGIRTYTATSKLAEFNRGLGVPAGDQAFDTSKMDNLQIAARDGTAFSVNLSGAATLQDVVDLINAAAGGTGVVASLTANHNGVTLVDSTPSATGNLTVQNSQAAEYLGFVSPDQAQHSATVVDALGNDVMAGAQVIDNDLVITASSGAEMWIDLTGTETVQDVIDRINNDPANAGVITARLAQVGNGIDLVDNAGGAGTLTVRAAEGSQAAEYLGFVATGQTQSAASDVHVDGSGNQVLTSRDRHMVETDSVFNTLLRLQNALEANNVEEIGRALDQLDVDFSRVSFARSEIGARLQSLETIGIKLQDENVQLKSALSQDIDIDLVEAISNMTARQYAFQASLQTTASILNLSLLDFI
jgi:flagellin-like hook-associated protein FlgL